MRAIRFHSFGGPEVLRLEDVEVPTIGPNDVLVQLKAAALNHLDIWVRSGARERSIPVPHIPGSDGAGVLADVGSAVDFLRPGERVLIVPGISCGHCEMCLGGSDNLCAVYHVLGTKEDGTYAEYVRVPAVNVIPLPHHLDFNHAAAIPLVFLTAWHMLIGVAKIKPGEVVLIQGAGSGVGSAAIQIAKLFGAYVITTASSEEKLRRAKDLGADEVIDYTASDFVEQVKQLTNKRGVDVVFEHSGGKIFERSLYALRKGGRLVTCGATGDFATTIDLRYIYARHLTLYGSFMGRKQEMAQVLTFFGHNGVGGNLRAVIDSVFPLAQAADAHRRMEERKNFGKIVLTI